MKIFLKVLDKLKKPESFEQECKYDKGWNDAIKKMEEIACTYSSADMWIPTDVKLPPEPKSGGLGVYLVTSKEREYPFKAYWNGEKFFAGCKEHKAIAWQPMPPVYKPWR